LTWKTFPFTHKFVLLFLFLTKLNKLIKHFGTLSTLIKSPGQDHPEAKPMTNDYFSTPFPAWENGQGANRLLT
jgi:hypothetical protein